MKRITSGESRKFFLPVLRQKPKTVVNQVKKNFVVPDKKMQMSPRYPLIQSRNPKLLNTQNFEF